MADVLIRNSVVVGAGESIIDDTSTSEDKVWSSNKVNGINSRLQAVENKFANFRQITRMISITKSIPSGSVSAPSDVQFDLKEQLDERATNINAVLTHMWKGSSDYGFPYIAGGQINTYVQSIKNGVVTVRNIGPAWDGYTAVFMVTYNIYD